MSFPDWFPYCAEYSLAREGGFYDDPVGGPTNFGISLKAFPDLTLGDIQSMTPERAATLYRARYWEPCGCGEMPVAIALMVFEAAINQGAARAVRWLQKALDVEEDGLVGRETLDALALADEKRTLQLIAGLRAYAYLECPTDQWRREAGGWRTRLRLTYSTCLGLLRQRGP